MTTSVSASAYYTRNLGNFESAKIGYGITSDEIREGETLDEFKNRLEAKVQKWTREAIESLDAEAAER